MEILALLEFLIFYVILRKINKEKERKKSETRKKDCFLLSVKLIFMIEMNMRVYDL